MRCAPVRHRAAHWFHASNWCSSQRLCDNLLLQGPLLPRGSGQEFVKVSWEKTIQLVANELNRVKSNFGNHTIYAGSYGWASAGRFHHAQSQLKRFLNCIGGYTGSVNTYSYAAAEVVVPHILGSFREHIDSSTSWNSIIDNCELFVALGGMPLLGTPTAP